MLAKNFSAKSIKKSDHTSAMRAKKVSKAKKHQQVQPNACKVSRSQNSYLFQSIPLLRDLTGFLACLVPFYASFELAWWRGSPEQRVNLAEGAVVPLGLGSERVKPFFLKEEIQLSFVYVFRRRFRGLSRNFRGPHQRNLLTLQPHIYEPKSISCNFRPTIDILYTKMSAWTSWTQWTCF